MIETISQRRSGARVRQYTQLLLFLKRDQDDWAEKVGKAAYVMPEYELLVLLVRSMQQG